MLIHNSKPICLIGYPQSTITQEAEGFISKEFSGKIVILLPEEFIALEDKSQYQYFIAFTLDKELRKQVINIVDTLNLDCITFVHATSVCYSDDIVKVIGRGSFVSPFSTLLLGSTVGDHSIIESYCLISHYVHLGNNTHVHSGVLIAGRTQVADNCMFNFRSTVLNNLRIVGDTELGALSAITKDVTVPGKYVGTPARKVADV